MMEDREQCRAVVNAVVNSRFYCGVQESYWLPDRRLSFKNGLAEQVTLAVTF
jgi:hypothetical protein